MRKEAFASRWMLEAEDVAPIVGPVGAMVWQQQIMSSDINLVVKEFDYRIEAGSIRKPNKAKGKYQRSKQKPRKYQ